MVLNISQICTIFFENAFNIKAGHISKQVVEIAFFFLIIVSAKTVCSCPSNQ